MEGLDYSRQDITNYQFWENNIYDKLEMLRYEKYSCDFENYKYYGALEFNVWTHDQMHKTVFVPIPFENYSKNNLLLCEGSFILNDDVSNEFSNFIQQISITEISYSLKDFLDSYYSEIEDYIGKEHKIKYTQQVILELKEEIKSRNRSNYILENITEYEIYSFDSIKRKFHEDFYTEDYLMKPLIDLFLTAEIDEFTYLPLPEVFNEYLFTKKYLVKILALKSSYQDIENDNLVFNSIKKQMTEDILFRQDPSFILAIASLVVKIEYTLIIDEILKSNSTRSISFFSNLFNYFKNNTNLKPFFKDSQPKEYIKIVNQEYPQLNFKRVVTHNTTETFISYFDKATNNYLNNK